MVHPVGLAEIKHNSVRDFITEFIKSEVLTDDVNLDISNAAGKGDNYIGVVIRVKVTGRKSNGEEIKKSFICKMAPQEENARINMPFVRFFTIEVYAYETVLREFKAMQNSHANNLQHSFNFLKCFKASKENCDEFVIMEDLSEKGYRTKNRKDIFDIEHFKLAFKHIAYFHAFSFALKVHRPEEYLKLAEYVDSKPWYNSEMDRFVDAKKTRAETELDDEFCLAKLKNLDRKFSEIFFTSTEPGDFIPYDILCHGDCWIPNILFEYEDEQPVNVALIDYQVMKRCSPVVDLIHLIFTASDEAFRKDHYEEIIDFYHATLGDRLEELGCDVEQCYPSTVFKQHLQKLLQFGLVISCMMLPMQLGEGEDIISIEEMAANSENNIIETFKNPKTKEEYCFRLSGVIRDLDKLNVL